MALTPIRSGQRFVSVKIDEVGFLRLEVDGEVLHTVSFATGCQLLINVDRLLMYKTTMGKRGSYGQKAR